MGRLRLQLALFLALALAAAVLGTRVARRLEAGGGLRVELARVRPTALSEHTLARFGALQERVIATYYVSPPAKMPAEMRRMELEVTDLLAALHARFPERFDYQVVDPEQDLAGFSARQRVSPFQVRSVTRDAWDERTVWSTLVLSAGARPEARLAGLKPEHLPYLQDLLTAWLDQLSAPRAPRIALAAPAGFEELAEALAESGTLTRVALDEGAPLPACDVLFWLRPARVDGAVLRALERLLANGTSVIVAGEAVEPLETVREGIPNVAFRPRTSALAELAAHFGLGLEPELVLDPTSEELEFAGAKVLAPHWLRCIAPNQDFHRFADQPNGTLLFRAPCAFVPVPERLRELGWNATVLATSSDGAWRGTPFADERALSTLARDESRALPKQALLVDLAHDEPGRGELVFAGAATPFEDGFLHREHVAHGRLLDVLLRETTSPERLVFAAVERAAPAPLPPLSAAQRLAWRAFGVALPLVLLVLVLHGRGLARGLGGLAERAASSTRRVAAPALALGAVLVVVRATQAADVAIDWTSVGSNSLAPETRAIAARSAALGSVSARLYVSERARLPPALRTPAQRIPELLREFARAGAPLRVVASAPEELPAPARRALASGGLETHVGSTSDDGVTRVTRFTCGLLLAHEGTTLALDFPDARSLERLEFRIALALERLGGRRQPRVAFASDIPRLTAAEAFEYQQKSEFAPGGNDVYALARASLARNDLAVVHVNPRAPELPAQSDVLVWLQPRRSIEPMLAATLDTLCAGGKVVLAAQHLQPKPQQFRGGDFALQYWPQPQSCDLEALYFPELGIELVREVLFDALSFPLATESELTGRGARREIERQESALPFQIRLSAANLGAHALTRNLGDQAFLWANRLRWDERKLGALGLRATPLAFTSAKTWSYAWTGGWIPPELLAGPVALEKSSGDGYLGRQPLMALFEGPFPRPTKPLKLNPTPEELAAAAQAAQDAPPSVPGKLVFIGDSACFENQRLTSDAFRGDQLLWNAVTNLALEPELASVAARARVTPGFGFVEPPTRLAWRVFVLGAGPALFLLAALGLALVRGRAPRGRDA
ncbi:MAG: hypothetical protein EXS08_08400 [Planctomycetes bacterium]|nr:hypothetical protein [Planctomycetota bacterium]